MAEIWNTYVTINYLKVYLTPVHASLTHAGPIPETENFFRKNKDNIPFLFSISKCWLHFYTLFQNYYTIENRARFPPTSFSSDPVVVQHWS